MTKTPSRPALKDVSARKVSPTHPRAMIDDTKSPWHELYVPPIGDGKSALQGRCDSSLMDQIMTLTQHPDTPFHNLSDFVRSAAEKLVQDVGHLLKDPTLSDSILKRKLIINALNSEAEGAAMLEMHQKTTQVIGDLIKEGDLVAARRHIRYIMDMARRMNDARWRRKTLALVEKWKDLVKE